MDIFACEGLWSHVIKLWFIFRKSEIFNDWDMVGWWLWVRFVQWLSLLFQLLANSLWQGGVPRDCVEDKCAWWTGKECVVMAVARKLLG